MFEAPFNVAEALFKPMILMSLVSIVAVKLHESSSCTSRDSLKMSSFSFDFSFYYIGSYWFENWIHNVVACGDLDYS